METTAESALLKFIRQQNPKFLVTIAFRSLRNRMSDAHALNRVNFLLWRINSAIFKSRFKRKEQFLEGFGVCEHNYNDAPHFHLLVTNDLDLKMLTESILRQARSRPFTVQINTSSPDDRALLRNSYKQGLPRSVVRARALEFIRHVPIFDFDAEGNGGIDVRPIGQTDKDFCRTATYLQKEQTVRGFMLLGSDGLIPNDDVGRTLAL
jgi:hypothetical protein